MALSAHRQHLLGGREQGAGTPSTPRSRHTSLWRPKLGSGTCEPEHGQSQTVLDCSMSKSVHTVHYGLSVPCMEMGPQLKGVMLPEENKLLEPLNLIHSKFWVELEVLQKISVINHA